MSERLWKQRVLITGPEQGGQREECVFEFTLSQRLGGCYDGYWVGWPVLPRLCAHARRLAEDMHMHMHHSASSLSMFFSGGGCPCTTLLLKFAGNEFPTTAWVSRVSFAKRLLAKANSNTMSSSMSFWVHLLPLAWHALNTLC